MQEPETGNYEKVFSYMQVMLAKTISTSSKQMEVDASSNESNNFFYMQMESSFKGKPITEIGRK